MIKEALQYLVGLRENKTYEINGDTYSDNRLELVPKKIWRRSCMEVGSLDAIVKMIHAELRDYKDTVGLPLYIQVDSYNSIEVVTRCDEQEQRMTPYSARCRDAEFKEGWRDQQSAIIELRSRFLPTQDSEYLLNLISRINNEQGVQSTDNGVSQTVTAKSGVSLMTTETVKPRLAHSELSAKLSSRKANSSSVLMTKAESAFLKRTAGSGRWKPSPTLPSISKPISKRISKPAVLS